jgi:hypothetical protein
LVCLGLCLVAVAIVLRWLHGTASQDLVAFLRQAPACRVESTRVDGRTWRLTLHDSLGPIEATLRLPPGTSPCDAVVILGGLRTGRRAVDLVDADLPYAVAALDYAAGDTKRIDGTEWLTRLPEILRDFKRTGVALRDLQAAVASHERVERVYLLGASLGTPLACAVTAAASPAGLILLYGFADHAPLFEHRLRPYVGWGPARRFLASFAGYLSTSFDPAATLPQACGTRILLIGSDDDEALPRQCTQALWDAACEPKQRVNLPGGHIDAGRKQEILQRATQAVRDWLETGASASVGARGEHP